MMDTNQGFWFLNSHATIQLSHADGADGTSVVALRMSRDDAPPLHVHHDEDEVFHVLDGEIRFLVDGKAVTARTGDTLLGPKGLPHGFRVTSDTARMLVVNHGGFEGLVRAMARPALHDGPPEHAVPTPEMQQVLAAVCAAQRIDLLGPPIA